MKNGRCINVSLSVLAGEGHDRGLRCSGLPLESDMFADF